MRDIAGKYFEFLSISPRHTDNLSQTDTKLQLADIQLHFTLKSQNTETSILVLQPAFHVTCIYLVCYFCLTQMKTKSLRAGKMFAVVITKW